MISKSLYIHIPFCLAKCAYCDFFSVASSTSVPASYINALLKELDFYKNYYEIDSFKTVYIGGGTPSLLSASQLSSILEAACLMPGAAPDEVTVEMNPETLSEGLLTVFSSCNAKRKRLSLGIQSLNENALRCVDRHCTASAARSALKLVKDRWNGDLSLDMIAGLPGQTRMEFISSLEECLSFNPEHFSLYSLMLEEGTPLFGRIGSLDWNCDEADSQWLEGRDILEKKAYAQYEVSNFCRAGHESIHNMAYWKQYDYIGIGSGATGSVYSFDGKSGLRWTNSKDIDSYISFWESFDAGLVSRRGRDDHSKILSEAVLTPSLKEPADDGSAVSGLVESLAAVRETESLSLEIEEEEFLMMGLRSVFGVSSIEYKRRFSSLEPWRGDLERRLGVRSGAWARFASLEGLEDDCLIRRSGNECVYSFKGEALSFLNTFLKYLT